MQAKRHINQKGEETSTCSNLKVKQPHKSVFSSLLRDFEPREESQNKRTIPLVAPKPPDLFADEHKDMNMSSERKSTRN